VTVATKPGRRRRQKRRTDSYELFEGQSEKQDEPVLRARSKNGHARTSNAAPSSFFLAADRRRLEARGNADGMVERGSVFGNNTAGQFWIGMKMVVNGLDGQRPIGAKSRPSPIKTRGARRKHTTVVCGNENVDEFFLSVASPAARAFVLLWMCNNTEG
jgi:hypothetical protein